MNNTKDLSKAPPRSPGARLGGFAILGRTIDKCHAELWGNSGEYHFNCPLDKEFFAFVGIDGVAFKKYVEQGHTDDEVAHWVKTAGTLHTDDEIEVWSRERERENYSNKPDTKAWLEHENLRLGLPKDGTLFDYLDADDKASFAGASGA